MIVENNLAVDWPSRDATLEGSEDRVPLVVDVDGTLIKSDLLYEAALQFVAARPMDCWKLPVWLSRGKPHLKRELAPYGVAAVASVPLREETLALVRDAQRQGRPVYLASASDRRLVEIIAMRVGSIAGVFATDGEVNLEGHAKAQRLVDEWGPGGFDYVGDSNVDLAVWAQARNVLAVTHDAGFERRVLASHPRASIIARPRPALRSYIKALRPQQWSKNVLVFLPLLAGHYFALHQIWLALAAFLCFSMAASSAYVVNDLLDLPGDRDHERKRRRPFASGALPILQGPLMAAGLAVAAFLLAWTVGERFAFTLALYFGATFTYSLVLKRKPVVDVVLLGGLYTLRVLGGVAALDVQASPWLLMFSLFFFLSLAIVKRCSELIARSKVDKGAPPGRGYCEDDLRILQPFGAAAAYASVLVVTLYLSNRDVLALYTHSVRLWLVCPFLIYWLARAFLISNRGEMHDDPVVFALTDRTSWVTALCVAAVVLASL